MNWMKVFYVVVVIECIGICCALATLGFVVYVAFNILRRSL